MPRRADVNKDQGRHSKKHGRKERIKREIGVVARLKPKTKTEQESSKLKK